MLWAIAAALAGVVMVAIAAPFLRMPGRGMAEEAALPAAAYDLRVYRSQLAEVDRDLARGVIPADEAERLRTEIGRKVLEADRALQRDAAAAAPARRAPRALAAAVALVVLGVGAFALYQWIGAPGMPDDPIALRTAEANRVYEERPTQAEAEAAVAARPPAPFMVPDPAYSQLIEQLRAAVAERPDDPQGLRLLAEHEARLGNVAAGARAMAHLNALNGAKASPADHAQLAALLVDAAGGLITREAEAEIARALAGDSNNPQARYLQGLLYIQNQRPDRAFPIWRNLLETAPPGAPWAESIRRVIPDLAWLAGQPDYQPPAAPRGPALPGPDAGAVAAAEGMSDEERQQMIAGMVSQLEGRLAAQGGTPEEWARLIRALHVQGNDAHAAEIAAEARTQFAAVPEALAQIETAVAAAGADVPGPAASTGPAAARQGAAGPGAAAAPRAAAGGAGTPSDATGAGGSAMGATPSGSPATTPAGGTAP
ncbi:c-type cytochrome biogenesis protein CcmI [Paracoccus suum]|uniref:c-type cytochrome biogenesis protein CcmI n=1 Tax=Paracoccus suum TaxID=2259340 RepID=UPI0018EFFA84|nr:c-type cytochrome biogenesis protein CcmI [Paracoccus suum]